MIDEDEFEKFEEIKPIIKKINKNIQKEKFDKVAKLLNQLIDLMKIETNIIPLTYLFSIVAERNIDLISETILSEICGLLKTKDDKILLNSITIIGFSMLHDPDLIDSYLGEFIGFLFEKDKDIRDNVYYFMQQLKEIDINSLCSHKSKLITLLKEEKSDSNILTILSILNKCSDFNFQELTLLRPILKDLYFTHYENENKKIISELNQISQNCFPSLRKIENFNSLNAKDFIKVLEDTFIITKKVFNYNEQDKLNKRIRESKTFENKDNFIYFYIKNNEDKTFSFFELEKSKLLNLFSSQKISNDYLFEKFHPFIQKESELQLFVSMLLKFNYIDGYYSELGFFYPLDYVSEEFQRKFQENGMVNLKTYDYFPPNFIDTVIENISKKSKLILLRGKNNTALYSLKKIIEQINKEAAKNSSINLKSYQDRIVKKDYDKLLNNLPEDYLTQYHRKTHWLTNLGLLNIRQEIENSQILGYLSIQNLAEKHNILKELLNDFIGEFIDLRSGIFNLNRDIFYYSKFLKERIDKINLIRNEQIKQKRINQLAKELNIKKNHIISKIDENLKLIGEEIKDKDEISISYYLDKTGMNREDFFNFIESLGLTYFKKGDLLVVNENKIADAKLEIQKKIIEKSKKVNVFSLGELDITPNLVKELLNELLERQEIQGIIYKVDGDTLFYTKKGIIEMIMEESFLISLEDLFPEIKLSEQDLEIVKAILRELMKSKVLNGTFDEETLTFSSNDVIFAQNYNIVLSEFEKLVNNYNSIFQAEFKKIKQILIKKNKNISPQEIKAIQESIEQINKKYVKWRHELDAFVSKANSELLKKQGFTVKRYKEMMRSTDYKKELKVFEDDLEVKNLMSQFQNWIKKFNNIELKYGNVIFYQKRVIRDPNDTKNEKKLNLLLKELDMV